MPDYYQQHFRDYHRTTFHIDPTSFLEPLARYLKCGDSILDVGCGSGRDLIWLQKQKFKVTGFERSAGLAELARCNVGCDVILGDFETFDFSKYTFDAMLLCGALVHIPHTRLIGVVGHVIQGVRDGGYILISLKAGEGCESGIDNRIFYLWKDEDLRELLDSLGLAVIEFQQNQSKRDEQDTWLSYVLRKAQ